MKLVGGNAIACVLLCVTCRLLQIVTDAYQRGKLVSVLPFIANLLSVCEKSLIFTPNNPMISGLLSLLAELHKLPHLRFNAQYCIEMIFKTFGECPQPLHAHSLTCVPTEDIMYMKLTGTAANAAQMARKGQFS